MSKIAGITEELWIFKKVSAPLLVSETGLPNRKRKKERKKNKSP
jgi:hypothetical protein